jgi:hypothetical protein
MMIEIVASETGSVAAVVEKNTADNQEDYSSFLI